MSLIEKIVHWFSPPEDTCVKGPTPEESAASRQEWRKAIHDSRHQVQIMQSLARETSRVLSDVSNDAHEVTDDTLKMAANALKALEKRRNERNENQ